MGVVLRETYKVACETAQNSYGADPEWRRAGHAGPKTNQRAPVISRWRVVHCQSQFVTDAGSRCPSCRATRTTCPR